MACIAGYYGRVSAGEEGMLILHYSVRSNYRKYGVNKDRVKIAYVGENHIFPHTQYELNESGMFVEL